MPDLVEKEIADNAAWAAQFRTAAVNPAQRARYQQQIKAGDAQQQQQADAQFERTLATDKTAQDFYFKKQSDARAERGQDRADYQASLAGQRFALDQEKAAALEQHKAADLELRAAKDKLQSGLALKQKVETTAAVKDLTDLYSRGVTKGSQDHVMSSLDIVANHPDADPVVLHQILGDAKIAGDPQEMVARLARIPKEQRAGMRVTMNPKGELSFSVGPEQAPKPGKPAADELVKTYDELHKVSSELSSYYDNEGKLKNGMNQTVLRQVRDRQQALSAKIETLKAPAAQPEAPSALPSDLAATAATETRQIFKDAAGNRAYKNPDGSFEPVQ